MIIDEESVGYFQTERLFNYCLISAEILLLILLANLHRTMRLKPELNFYPSRILFLRQTI